MSRTVERLIDLAATVLLLGFAYFFREGQPGLAGAVVMASISFWLQKNAQSADSPAHKVAAEQSMSNALAAEAAALAAAQVLRTAEQALVAKKAVI